MMPFNHPKIPLVAILRGIRPDEVIEHSKALYNEGFRCIEVPTNSPDWEKSLTRLTQHFKNEKDVLIGAGTILTQEHYDQFKSAGGRLMVTPNFNPALAQQGVNDGMITCIGALTPSEIIAAAQIGADIVKIFPAGNMGIGYCKSVLTIAPKHCEYYCVGGVTSENLAEFLSIGFTGAGLGSDLYRPGQSVQTTTENAQKFVNAYNTFKHEN